MSLKLFIVGQLLSAQVFANALNLNHDQNFPNWIKSETQISENKLLQAMSQPDTAEGAVIASPSREKPNYYFHWVRDAALSMDAIVDLYKRTSSPDDKKNLEKKILNYIKFSQSNQRAGALTGLGEPKFYVDGRPYDLPWGRPQNDGPALRALTLIKYAKSKIDDGQTDYVKQNLYDSQLPSHSIIKADLEYVASQWQNPSFDLWEEVLGDHFFTLAAQKSALEQGAQLAQTLGDSGASDWYLKQSQKIAAKLNQFFNSPEKYILATVNRTGGLGSKASNLDTAVLLGLLRSNNFHTDYNWNQSKVIGTVKALTKAFTDLYPINKSQPAPAVAIGRYPEDVYDGDAFQGGNPWVLTTLAVAETYYELAAWTLKHTGEKTDAAKYIELGDAFFARVQLHANTDGSLSEQISRFNGYMTSAVDLTWNYAAILTTSWARERAQQ
ncbi:MAG: glycoside hydrolase family 15 protein [Pseudobdellovibrio sp.]